MSNKDIKRTVSDSRPSSVAQVHISVRGLVEFVLRHGDIDSSHKGSSGPEVMLEGANIHRMIQRRMGTTYHSEYYLRHITRRPEYDIVIDGRADGIIIPVEWEPFIIDCSEYDTGDDPDSEFYVDTDLLMNPDGDLNVSDKKMPDAVDGDTAADVTGDATGNETGNKSDDAAESDSKIDAAIDTNAAVTEEYADIIALSSETDLTVMEAADDNSLSRYPGKKITIDEIKTTYRELEHIQAPEPVHLAQAKCYAFIFASINKLPSITVRMTYCNSESHETRYFDSDYTYAEIRDWFNGLIREYIRWTDFSINWKRERNASIEAISFPYPYRSGQKELVAQVFNSIEKKEHLYIMAPTGVGKTLANVYPSLKGLALGRAEKIFYLTAKTITRTVAADCFNLLRQQKMRLKTVMLTAKEKICPMEKQECNPQKCPYAKGHFDRINAAMFDLLSNEDDFSREKIMEYADKHMVCPFEFSLDMSLFSDAIICDYNYVFDPNVYLRRYFSEGAAGQYLFLVDEAHNLVDRAMSMYSASISKEKVLDVKRLVKDADPRLARTIESLNKMLLAYKRECEEYRVVEHFEPLIPVLLRVSGKIEQFLDDVDHLHHFNDTDAVLDLYFDIRHFMNIYENMKEEDYVLYTKQEGDDFVVHLMCANPAEWIKTCTDKARFTVFFSATLLPINYYRKMLGAGDNDPAVYARSVFDPSRRKLLVARDVTSKYSRRSDGEYARMAEYISCITRAKDGNYIVFFPSFAMLDRVLEIYVNRFFDESRQEIVTQGQYMTEQDREEFINRFNEEKEYESLVGFCVLGGIFSEGIDLKNEALIGAIIIGTGLPMVCVERDLLKRRYDEMGLDGFAYAYRYPGMNKVNQAAGRVIRTSEDTGVVALLDERFLNNDYQRLFPREWSNYSSCRVDDVEEYLEEFWNTKFD